MKLNRRQRRLELRRQSSTKPEAEIPAMPGETWRELADAEFNLASGMAYPTECAKSSRRFMVDETRAGACGGCPFEEWCKAMYGIYLEDKMVADGVFELELEDFAESVARGEMPRYRPSRPTNDMAGWPLPL